MEAQLQIKLLGQFQISQDGLVIHQFESNKVRAFLAYLAVENRVLCKKAIQAFDDDDRPHFCDELTNMLQNY